MREDLIRGPNVALRELRRRRRRGKARVKSRNDTRSKEEDATSTLLMPILEHVSDFHLFQVTGLEILYTA